MEGEICYKKGFLLLLAFVCLAIQAVHSQNPHHDCATSHEFNSQDMVQEDQAELEMFGKIVRCVSDMSL